MNSTDITGTPPSAARYTERDAKSITRVPGTVDPWFLGRYGMNLYRGCEHGCVYCDGRAERYYVEGNFARDIVVKRNALEVLSAELDRIREPGFLFLGGGVCDAYQPAEARYHLARGALELALRHQLPVHVLTKSALVERDLDLLADIAAARRAVLSFSIGLHDEGARERFEPGAAPLAERWRLLEEGRRQGLTTGVMIMPVLPGVSDMPEAIDALVGRAAQAGASFVLFGGLTLRPGRQKDGYFELVARHYPEHLPGYERVYRANRRSGAAAPRYYARIQQRFTDSRTRHGLPGRIPRAVFHGLIPRYAEAAVLLEHADFERAEARAGEAGPLTRAGHGLQRWARERFAKNRRRSYDWRAVEAELVTAMAEGTVRTWPDLVDEALPILADVLALSASDGMNGADEVP